MTIDEYKKEGYIVRHDKCLPDSSPVCILPDVIVDWKVGNRCTFNSQLGGHCLDVEKGRCTGWLIGHKDGLGVFQDTYCGRHRIFSKE